MSSIIGQKGVINNLSTRRSKERTKLREGGEFQYTESIWEREQNHRERATRNKYGGKVGLKDELGGGENWADRAKAKVKKKKKKKKTRS